MFFISFEGQLSIFLLDLGSKADHKTGTMKRRTITMMMIAHWSALVPRRLEDYQGPKPLRACRPTTLTSLTPANQIQYTRFSLKNKGSSPKSFHITRLPVAIARLKMSAFCPIFFVLVNIRAFHFYTFFELSLVLLTTQAHGL